MPDPSQLFSFTPNATVLPSDPTPAPAVISPVGFSSTVMSIILRSFSDPGFTLEFTSEKIPLALNSESD